MNMDEYPAKTFRSKFIAMVVTLVLIIMLLIGFCLYFYYWRPSDSDIEKAQGEASILKAGVLQEMPAAMQIVSHSNYINETINTKLYESVANYRQALAALDQSPAIQHDGTIGSAYTAVRGELSDFVQYLSSLSDSIAAYTRIRVTCNDYITNINGHKITSSQQFDGLASDCTKAIADSKKISGDDFSDQFFDKYRNKAVALLKSTEQFYLASLTHNGSDLPAAIKAYKKSQIDMYRIGDVIIKYSVKFPSPEDINRLTESLSGQKAQFWRL